jgi:type I restriction enzyme R subunit
MLNEADTRAKLIDPELWKSGWDESKIKRDIYIPGKIIDENGRRQRPKKPDYVLYYNPYLPIAVVEAKEEGKSALDGMAQAKEYAKRLGVFFAYSTNGHEIEEFDFTTNIQRTIERFPTPEELYKRYSEFVFKQETKVDPLKYPYYSVPGGKKPRYYQEAAIKRAIEAILQGKKRVLLTMATGTGKTFVAFQIVWKLLNSGYFQRVLYIADRNFLRDQAYNEFAPFEDARAIIEEGNAPKNRQVYFSIYQALYSGDEEKRLYREYPPDFFDMVIIDECHRSGYGTWKEILDYFGDAVHLGMTATPKRSDNIDTYAYFGKPVYSYSMGQGIEDGFLAPFHIYRIFTNIDKKGLHLEEALHQGARVYIPEETDVRDIYTLENFEREIILPDRTKKICQHLASLLDKFGPLEKTIVFCVNREHAAQVAKELQNSFAHLGYSDYAVRIVAEESDVKEVYENFKDSEKTTPVVATTVDLLTTGVDIPSVKNLVFLKPISSKVYFKQHIGRGSRIDKVSKKYFFRIIDYVNATRLLDDWDYPSDVGGAVEVEGPFDLELRGFVLHSETNEPIDSATIKAQIAPNMQRLAKSDGRGYFVLDRLPCFSITLVISKYGFRTRRVTITPSEDMEPIIVELKPEKPKRKKIVAEGVEVYIAEETQVFISSSGKTLTDAEYKEYSKEGVIKRVATLGDFYKLWIDREKRRKFLEELYKESINPELLANILKAPDADAFDVLAHVAFGAPILTRDERARAFMNKKKKVIEALGGKAQEVVLSLLEKYKAGGIEQITSPDIFEVSPFDKMGYLRGVAEIFGGIDKLKEAIELIEKGIYESVEV